MSPFRASGKSPFIYAEKGLCQEEQSPRTPLIDLVINDFRSGTRDVLVTPARDLARIYFRQIPAQRGHLQGVHRLPVLPFQDHAAVGAEPHLEVQVGVGSRSLVRAVSVEQEGG